MNPWWPFRRFLGQFEDHAEFGSGEAGSGIVEFQALLKDLAHVRKLPPPEDLGQACRLVAAMGGDLNRSRDGPPGAQVTWNGQAALSFTAWMLGHSVDAGDDSVVRQHIR